MLYVKSVSYKTEKLIFFFDFFFFLKDTSCMFLLYRRLSGVDGFADAAQLGGEERN